MIARDWERTPIVSLFQWASVAMHPYFSLMEQTATFWHRLRASLSHLHRKRDRHSHRRAYS